MKDQTNLNVMAKTTDKIDGADQYATRFIRQSDPQISKFIFELPPTWWSRPYEYAWASQFAAPGDIVLDAACGIEHPLKFYLIDQCSAVYACDLDDRLLMPERIYREIVAIFGQEAADTFPQSNLDKVRFQKADIKKLPYEDEQFNQIYCISVLEHLDPVGQKLALEEFQRTLKQNGLLILTFDYPTVDLEYFQDIVAESGLSFGGSINFALPEDALKSKIYSGLYCFRAILKKEK
jgi:SAM-dependent methyltransferase